MSEEDQIINSQPYNELQKVLKSFSSNISNKKEEVGGSCVKEAEAEVAATMMELRQHKASGGGGESTTPPVAATPSIATTSAADLTEAKGGEDYLLLLNDDAPMPQTLDEATDHINKLKTMRDSLLEEKNRNDKFVSRYQEKVAKAERIATLHHLIPRQLFVREDRYNEELEKVYKWSGITDQEIADFYRRKLANNSTKFKHHGAASTRGDPYQNFRDVPDFSKAVNGKPVSSSSSPNSVLRDLEFMKKIAGGGGGSDSNN